MKKAALEHVNITVTDPERSAALMCDVFGWHIRWKGPSMGNGFTIHVGTDAQYLAFYTNETVRAKDPRFEKMQPMNHIALTVDDLDTAEKGIAAAGLTPFGHDDYEPGRRFYFYDWNSIEFEVVSYA